MTRWVAILEDNPEEQAGWVRKQHAEDHFADLGDTPTRSDWPEVCDLTRMSGGMAACG